MSSEAVTAKGGNMRILRILILAILLASAVVISQNNPSYAQQEPPPSPDQAATEATELEPLQPPQGDQPQTAPKPAPKTEAKKEQPAKPPEPPKPLVSDEYFLMMCHNAELNGKNGIFLGSGKLSYTEPQDMSVFYQDGKIIKNLTAEEVAGQAALRRRQVAWSAWNRIDGFVQICINGALPDSSIKIIDVIVDGPDCLKADRAGCQWQANITNQLGAADPRPWIKSEKAVFTVINAGHFAAKPVGITGKLSALTEALAIDGFSTEWVRKIK